MSRSSNALVSSLIIPIGCLLIASCTTTGGSSAPFLIKEMGSLSYEQGVTDLLGPKEAINPRSGAPYRTYQIDLAAGEVVLFTATSSEFPPGISLFTMDGALLESSDDDGRGRATLARRIPKSGSYLVVISGKSSGDFGAFELEAKTLEIASEVTLPGIIQGYLFGGGQPHPSTGGFMNTYPLELREAAVLELTLESRDFDTFLSLARAGTGQMIAENDDSGEGTDSRLLVELEPGNYEVMASSYGTGSTGLYTLEVKETTIERSDSFALGELFQGFMGADRATLPSSDRTGVPLRFQIQEQGSYDFLMRSEDFDSYLVLTNEQGAIIAEDDDGGDGLNARITRSLEPGRYVLWATSYSASDTGRFTVMAQTFSLPDPTASVSVGSTVEGTLTESSPICRHRSTRIQYYSLSVHSPMEVRIDLTSNDFDAFLSLEDESGEMLEANDDLAPNDTNSRIVRQLAPGNYRIGASAFGEDELGAFSLSIQHADSTGI